MKKFLIGVILIIPIIVVLALNATGAIISSATPVNPTGIVVRNSENEELGKGDYIKVDIDNQNEFIIVDVLPTITQNKEISYERDEDAGEGEIELEKIEGTNRYAIIPVKVGSTKITIRAKSNINAYKEVSVHVTSDKIESANVYDADGNVLNDVVNYVITGTTRLYADVYPIEAMASVTWMSFQPEIATVSDNGVVTPVGRGKANITMQAKDKDGVVTNVSFEVNTERCMVSQNVIYVTEEEVITEEVVLARVALFADTVIEKLEDADDGSARYLLTYTDEDGEVYEEIVEVRVCEPEQIAFVEDGIETVYTRNGAYRAQIINLADGTIIEEGVSYESSHPEVMTVASDGSLEPLKAGETTIRATYNGKHVDRTYTVRERPATFELELGTADAKLGIQLKRVWGLKWLQKTDSGYSITDKYSFGIYGDTGAFDVKWSVNNEEYASITPTGENNDIEITFYEAAAGNKVTITATVLVDGREDMRSKRSFTFEMRSRAESVNIYSFEEAQYVHNNMKCTEFVLQNDITATDTIEYITASVYGNGFTWDASGIPDMDMSTGTFYYSFWESTTTFDEHECWAADGYTIDFDDIIIFNAKTLEESALRGSGIRVRGIYYETRDINDEAKGIEGSRYGRYGRDTSPKDIPVNIRFCQIYNTDRAIEIDELRDATVEGCILGDNNNHAIMATYPSEKYRSAKRQGIEGDTSFSLTLRNNVVKQSQGPAILITQSVVNMDIRGEYAPNLNIEGCLDIYNWKEEDDFIDAVLTMAFQYVGMTDKGDAIKSVAETVGINKILKEEVLGPNAPGGSALYYGYAGEKYVSLGIFACGALYDYDIDGNRTHISDDAGLTTRVIKFSDENGKTYDTVSAVESIFAMFMPTEITLALPSYLVCTDFSKGDPEIMPGDPVPNSIELYNKLRGLSE